MPLTIGSMFSGIGGLDLGLERAGLGPVLWQAEAEPYCRRVLAKHWPGVPCFDDVASIDAHVERPDLVAGGPPCQDLSVAGTRSGLDGARSGLWTEFARVVDVLRPAWVVIENVPGLLTGVTQARADELDRALGTQLALDGPADEPLVYTWMGAFLGDLAACGYDAVWDSVPAAAIGAPHRRDRVFVVAWRVPDASGYGVRDLAERGPSASLSTDGRDAQPEHVGPPVADTSSGGRSSSSSSGRQPVRRRGPVARSDEGLQDAVGDAYRTGPQGGAKPVVDGEERLQVAGVRGQPPVADALGERRSGRPSGARRQTGPRPEGHDERLAHADSERRAQRGASAQSEQAQCAGAYGRVLANADRWRFEIERIARRQPGDIGAPRNVADGCDLPLWPPASDDMLAWGRVPTEAQPAVCRMADGLPDRVHRRRRTRLKALGNAVVPQVAEVVGRMIVAALQEVT